MSYPVASARGFKKTTEPPLYIVRDDFTDTLAAGNVNDTAATPGPGTRDVTDSADKLALTSNDYLSITAGTGAWNDPVIAYDEPLTRGEGALLSVQRYRVNSQGSGVFLNPAAKPAAPGTGGYGYQLDATAGGLYGAIGGSNRVIRSVEYTGKNNADHLAVIVPKPTGAYVLLAASHLHGRDKARLLWVDEAGTDATLYAGLAGYTSGTQGEVYSKSIRIVPARNLPRHWLTQWGLATAYDEFTRADGAIGTSTSGHVWTNIRGTFEIAGNKVKPTVTGWSVAAIETGRSDGWFEIDFTLSASGWQGVVFRAVDDENYWAFVYRVSTNIAQLYKWINNTATGVTNTPMSLTAGTTHRLRVLAHGTRINCYIDDTYCVTTTSSDLQTATIAGVTSFNDITATGDNFAVWPLTVDLPYALEFPVAAPEGKGAALQTDTFTDTDGTALATHNALWTVGAGTWEVQGNKAQQTAADAVGHVVMDAGTSDHEAEVTITMPADTPTTGDWFPTVLVRYTDANNYVFGRLLYQSNSPEIEIFERVGGVTSGLLSAVNLGAGGLAANTEYTLKVAIKGQEVAAYLDGVLRIQTTTTVTTGNYAGFGTLGANEGQAKWDDWTLRAA